MNFAHSASLSCTRVRTVLLREFFWATRGEKKENSLCLPRPIEEVIAAPASCNKTHVLAYGRRRRKSPATIGIPSSATVPGSGTTRTCTIRLAQKPFVPVLMACAWNVQNDQGLLGSTTVALN